MKQLKLIAAAVVMAGCSGQPTPTRPTAQNVADKLTVQLACGAEITSGQAIGLKITAPDNAVPDSAVATIDGRKFRFGAGSAQTDIETAGLTVGQ
ncbi:MAG: hypothetical protein J6X32_09175, partial [Salinivirgaceae bacterium]|nr:hypothetical protein [Salinivirgaceae bacterium]